MRLRALAGFLAAATCVERSHAGGHCSGEAAARRDLLAQYQAMKGSAFDLQSFRDDLLSHGTVPVSVVASEMLAE